MNKGRVAVLGVADLRHMTCVNFYCEYFAEKGIEFDIICMNRYEKKSTTIYDCGLYQFDNLLKPGDSKVKKLMAFFKFKKYASKLIKDKGYDFIVVWGENTACLFSDVLKKHGNYCVNVRDYFDGMSKKLKPVLDKVNYKSRFCTVPSPRGLNYLVGKKYILLNKDYQVIKKYGKESTFEKAQGRIRVVYMGLINAYAESFEKFLSVFKNDSRFELHFYGQGADDELKAYASEKGIENAVFGGAFSPDKTYELLEKTDIINSVYGKSNYGVEDAVGVKESYAPLLHIPVLSDEGCFFAGKSEEYGFGLGVKICDELPDRIYEWYTSIEKESFDEGCDRYADMVNENNMKVINELDKFLSEQKNIENILKR